MSSSNLLHQAIEAARAGRKVEARDLLLQVVESDPRNEMAWMWLSGLVDSLEDRIIACENVLTINPANEKVRGYLAELQRRKNASLAKRNIDEAVDLLNRARESAERGEKDAALRLAQEALEKNNQYEDAWLLIAKVSPDLNQQLTALEKALSINPSNAGAVSALKEVRRLRANPLRWAEQLELDGKFNEALEVYKVQAAKAKSGREFDHIYGQITRIEGLQEEKIHYVSPASSIARLTFGWPLIYLLFAFVQVGLNPFAHPAWYLWFGLPWVALGGFLLASAEIRSRHGVWGKLLSEYGDRSKILRLMAATAGWLLIIFPHILLLLDSLNRLNHFEIPPLPFR